MLVVVDQSLFVRQRNLFWRWNSSLLAKHVEESMQCGRTTTSYRARVLLTPQKTLHQRFVKEMDFYSSPPQPLAKPDDQLRLILNRPRRIAQLPDKFRECVLVPGPKA